MHLVPFYLIFDFEFAVNGDDEKEDLERRNVFLDAFRC